jgi:hypothetical protein
MHSTLNHNKPIRTPIRTTTFPTRIDEELSKLAHDAMRIPDPHPYGIRLPL